MSGHGHVTPNADGRRAKCGGIGICPECSIEAGVAYQLPVGTGTIMPAPVGWECPRCRVVHAPFVMRCNCTQAADEYRRPEPTPMPGELERR